MMETPLLLTSFLLRAADLYARKPLVSREATATFRYTYGDAYRRICRLANALRALGVQPGDRVATFAWNHHRHLELYFGIPGIGAVLHTVNIRLGPDHLAYILNHAEDRVLFADADLLPALEPLAGRVPQLQHLVVMGGGRQPASPLPSATVHDYEDLLATQPDHYDFPPDLDERQPAGMCYTSATTGNPKGVVYSHRGLFLHSLMVCLPDMMGLAEADTVMPVVPMFHANAWGMPFAATAVGAAQVFPGPRPDPAALVDLVERERVTVSAGVPTVWMGVLQLLEQSPRDLSSLRTIVCGGSAVPRSLIEAYEKKYGVTVVQGYGMTETSPLVSICRIKSYLQDRPEDERYALRARQGLYAPGLQVRVVDAAGRDVPRDGKAMGEVWIRGPWVADAYYNDPRTAEAFPGDGWYHSGDVATVDAEGYLAIVDRMKDLIKSGGEWISSVDLENALMGHPDVLEAAVIAVPDPKWQERPLACVVPRPEARQRLTAQDLRAFLAERFPRWWVPDEVVFIEEVPKTGVGKFDKKLLRERYRDRGARSGPNPPAATSA